MTSEAYSLPSLTVDLDQSWRSQAACKGIKADLFFPEDDAAINRSTACKAVAVCIGCPVRFPCLQFAVENCLHYGIYGGVTAQNRRSFRSRGYDESDVLLSLPRALSILNVAQVDNPLKELARLKGMTIEEILEEGSDGDRNWI